MAHDIAALLEDRLPVVLFDRYFPGLGTRNIIVDNLGGAHQATRHLIGNGYASIGFVTLDSEQTQMRDRLMGYCQAMEQAGLTEAVLKIPYNREKEQFVTANVGRFIDAHPGMQAILFATNYLAIGGLEAMLQRRLKMPDDM